MVLPRFIVATLLAVAPVVLAAGSHHRFDPVAEGKALLQRDAEWADAARAGKDVEKIVSYWSDDAVVIEPGQPAIAGKAAIRAFVTDSLKTPGFKIHWVSRDPVFSDDGSMAYMPGADEMTMPGPDGKLVTVHTQGISIWRRKPGGRWLCVADIATEAPPPPASAKPSS